MSTEPAEPVDLASRSGDGHYAGNPDAAKALTTARVCPFCKSGQQALVLDLTEHYVHCVICDALGPPHVTVLAAVAAWNGYHDVSNHVQA